MSEIGSFPSSMGAQLWGQLSAQAATARKGASAGGSGPAPAEATPKAGPDAIEALKQFEGVLLHRLIGAMRESVPDGGLFEDPSGKQMQDLFWFQMTEEMTRQGGLGMWKQLARQLSADGMDLGGQGEQGSSLELTR